MANLSILLLLTAFVLAAISVGDGRRRKDTTSSRLLSSDEIEELIHLQLANPSRMFHERRRRKPKQVTKATDCDAHNNLNSPSASIPGQCLAYYPLIGDYGTKDASKHHQNGKRVETPLQPTDGPFPPLPHSGFRFSAIGHHVEVDVTQTQLATLSDGSFTISLFAKQAVNAPSFMPLVEYSFPSANTPPQGTHLWLSQDSKVLTFQTMSCNTLDNYAEGLCSDGVNAKNNWHFFAAVYNATANTIQGYCNNATPGPKTLPANCKPVTSNQLNLGYRAVVAGEARFDGRMACVSVCQGAMTPAELANMQALCLKFYGSH